jgi:5-methylcytosine-specific restriction endonuclease McrA
MLVSACPKPTRLTEADKLIARAKKMRTRQDIVRQRAIERNRVKRESMTWQERREKASWRSTVGRTKQRRMKEYAAYLRSPAWKALRLVVFERDLWACRSCGDCAGYFVSGKRDPRGLECDHLHYRSWMRESPADLQTLCRPCHRRKHGGNWQRRIPSSALNQVPPK